MQKVYTLALGGSYVTSGLQAHLNAELSFTTGISSKGQSAFTVYFDDADDVTLIDAAVASYDSDSVSIEATLALERLWMEHDRIIDATTVTDTGRNKGKDTKLTKSLRKESKGLADAKDIQRLDDNDLLDSWYDDMESIAETEGEQWIEDPLRTVEELKAFDPSDINWPTLGVA